MKVFNITLRIIPFFLAALLIGGGCNINSAENGGDPPPITPPPTTYTLSTTASPQEAGNITPSSGTFNENVQISVEANANEGWRFDRWSGDIESTDNPLSFNITSNTSLTANFIDVASAYTVSLVAVNSGNQIDLTFGQQDTPESVDAPPAPPQGAFHAWLERDGKSLFTDILSSGLTEAAWKLNLQPGSGEDTVNLSWQLEIDLAEGSLIMTDQAGSFELDMFTEDTYVIDATQTNVLIIEYTLDVD